VFVHEVLCLILKLSLQTYRQFVNISGLACEMSELQCLVMSFYLSGLEKKRTETCSSCHKKVDCL